LWTQMRAMGVEVPLPPSPEAGRADVMRGLWTGAGLEAVEMREIIVRRTFEDFEDYWTTVRGGPSVRTGMASMPAEDLGRLKEKMRQRLAADGGGRITLGARANAVKGRVRV